MACVPSPSIAVLLFHAGLSWIPGGTLGVDVFFVLSGFLITALLVAEHDRSRHASGSGRSTCAGRGGCCPALVLVLLFVGIAWGLVLKPRTPDPARRRPRDALLRRQLAFRLLRPGLLRVVQRAVAAAAHLVAGGGGAVLPALAAGRHPAAARAGAACRAGRSALVALAFVNTLLESLAGRLDRPALLRHRHPRHRRCCSERRSVPGTSRRDRPSRLGRARAGCAAARRACGCGRHAVDVPRGRRAVRRSSTAAASC